MSRTSICPKCDFNEILQVAKVPDVGHGGVIRQLNVATIFRGAGVFDDWKDSAGALSATVCRRCGYTEFYAANPESIPVDGKYVSLTKGESS